MPGCAIAIASTRELSPMIDRPRGLTFRFAYN